MTLVLEVPKLDMTRKEQSQPQGLALEGNVIEHQILVPRSRIKNCCVDFDLQPTFRRLNTYLHAKLKPHSPTVHLPTQQQSEEVQRRVERSMNLHPISVLDEDFPEADLSETPWILSTDNIQSRILGETV